MIIITQPNLTPMVRGILATRQPAELLNTPTPATLGIVCDCSCIYRTPVFASTDPASTEFQNDQSDFIFRTVLAGDTVTIELFKEGALLATIIDDTYGTYFPLGSITPQPLYVGFLLDWQKVLTLEGPGSYEVRAEVNVLGVITDFFSEPFSLLPYSNQAVNGTIRVDSFCNSNVESSEFNFIDINWFKSKRIRGEFSRIQKIEINNYKDQSRRKHRIQDQILNEYELITSIIPGEITDAIIYQHLLGDEVIVTAYNINNPREYVGVELYPSEISAVDTDGSGREMRKIKFTDKQENIIARRFN